MNKLMKKAAALMTAALMTVSSVGTECFAQSSAELSKTSVTVQYDAAVAKPTYKVKGTTGVRRVQLSTSTAGATIYYTTNGTKPTTKSRKYPAGAFIKITKDTKIRAIAVLGSTTSAIMTKTFKVATLTGDVTGDGNVNSTDLARLKNYFAGKTKFICKDNADCDGSGGLNKVKDPYVLQQYLNKEISKIPAKYVAPLTAPMVSLTKVFGGVKVSLSGSESGAAYYYTLNGTTPTNTSSKYTSPITVEKTCTIKVVSYKNGSYSASKATTITVPNSGTVSSNQNPDTKYEKAIDVSLFCSTADSVIYYTLDGTDPRTSNTVLEYSKPITISKNTTLKAYSSAKGCIDSDVTTYNYKVDAAFNISGTVWDDTPGTTVISDGKKSTGESGISDITVYLVPASLVTDNMILSATYIKKTTTDRNGYYEFENLPDGTYKVIFEYNAQKYRGYSSLVEGGSQAIPIKKNDFIVTNKGAYEKGSTGYWDKNINNINNYRTAVTSSDFTIWAATSRSYNTATANVDFALISKHYGALELSMKVEGQTSDNMAQRGTRLTYTISLTNNSPMSIDTLNHAAINVYLPRSCDSWDVSVSSGSKNVTSHGVNGADYQELSITEFVGASGLAQGKTATIVIVTAPDRVEKGEVLRAFAEITEYRFATNCYDYYSIPGNLTIGSVRERDEATTTAITIGTSTASDTTDKSITVLGSGTLNLFRGDEVTDGFVVVVKNAISKEDAIIGEMNGDTITYDKKVILEDKTLYIFFTVYANTLESGKTTITVYLADNPKKKVTLTALVRE